MSSPTTQQNRTQLIPFLDACTSNNCSHTIGGVLSNSRTAWIACGAHIRVCDLRSGRRIGSWHFGHTIRDHTTQILCVTELNHWSLLVVGLSSGLVCVYEPVTSRVLRAINIGTPVKCVTEVNSSRPGRLAEAFDGVLAVGLDGGDVFLLDLCWHTITEVLNIYSGSVICDEERPCEISVLNGGDLGRLSRLKERAANAGRHLAYHLNYHPAMDDEVIADCGDATPSEPHFPLQSPGGADVLLSVPRSHCTITSLMYAQPLCAVLIGYSLGCWQMFSLLDDMPAQYTSLWHRDRVPVAYFALQEPTDDPRTCCYVWAVHSHTGQRTAEAPACAVMYSLSYEGKEAHDGYGCLYERLTSCTIRFQMDLTSDVIATTAGEEGSKSRAHTTSQCLATRSYSLGAASSGDALVLCALSYTTGGRNTYLLLFDLNQWYLSQMPSEPRTGQWPMYMARLQLPPSSGTVAALDVRLDVASLCTFRHSLRRPEEHFRPDALSYTCTALTSTGITQHHHQGTQSHLLHTLHTLGSLALLKPIHLYGWAQVVGLLNHQQQLLHTPAIQQQREALLDIALEHHQLQHSVLERCATDWADGSSLAVGCGLHGWLMEWAWARANTLKRDLDGLCVMLFDGDGVLDGRAKAQLDAYKGQLGRLRRLFEHVRGLGDEGGGGSMVERRGETLAAVCRWLGVLRWLLTIGLLPERTDYDDSASAAASIDRVKVALANRRVDLNKTQLNLDTNESKLPKPQLFIDALIENELGGATVLNDLWTNSTASPSPPYPPNSLQAALRTYLIQAQSTTQPSKSTDTLVQYQHTLFSYLMLDIAAAAAEHQQQQLIGFPVACTALGQQRAKLIQAMWQLDRGMFEQAMEQLVDPTVTTHAPPWLHRCIVVQLLAHARHRFALLYVQLRRPPRLRAHDDVVMATDDDWLMSTMLVRNGRLYDALKCARDYRKRLQRRQRRADDNLVMIAEEVDNDDELLSHIWAESLRSGQLNSSTLITSIHGLSSREEMSLFRYMDRVEYPNRHRLRAIYTMQRSTKPTTPPKPIETSDDKFDGSVPMSVLIHYNNLTTASSKSRQSSKLSKVHDVCVATVGAILAGGGQHQQRQLRGQKRKQQPQQQLTDKSRKPQALPSPQDSYSSPQKRMKYTPTVGGDRTIDSSYQMETPLVRRQRPLLAQYRTPSMTSHTDNNIMETPQSILKKKIVVSDSETSNVMVEQRRKGESTTPEVIVVVDNVKLASLKRRRSIAAAAAAVAIATVRFDISLSTTSSADSCTPLHIDLSTATADSKDSDVTTTTTTSSTTETTFYSPNNSSGELAATVAEDNTELLLSKLPEVIGRAKSPMRRKPIRGVSEEPVSGIRSSPRLQRRRSADRDIKPSNLTVTEFVLSGAMELLSGRKSTNSSLNAKQDNATASAVNLSSLKTAPEKQSNVSQTEDAKLIHHTTKVSASSTKTSKCTLFAIDGIEQIHEESTITVNEEETSSKTVDIIEDDVNKLSTADNNVETVKQSATTFVVGERNVDGAKKEEIVEHQQLVDDESTTKPVEVDLDKVESSDLEPHSPNTNGSSTEFKDVLHEEGYADDASDIYNDLDILPGEVDQEETIYVNQSDVDDEPMDVDEDHDDNDVIEIMSSSNDDSSDSTVNSSHRHNTASEEQNSYSNCSDASRATEIDFSGESNSLNRAAFIQHEEDYDDSRSRSSSSRQDDSNSQFPKRRSHPSALESIESAETCRLGDDINVSNGDDNISDRDKQLNTDGIYHKSEGREDDDDDYNSGVLNLNVTEGDDDDDVVECKETLTSVNIEDERKISDEVEDAVVVTTDGDAEVDILQVTCTETGIVGVGMEQDVLCMSFPEQNDDLTIEVNEVILFQSVETTTAKEDEIDPIIEDSAIEEVIHVEPDVLIVTFSEQTEQTTNEVGTRRSARLRRDSAASNTSSKKSVETSSASVKAKPPRKPRTTRSLSVDAEDATQSSSANLRVSTTRLARRSDRRTRSVDTQQQQMEDVKQQWLSTIVEEQQQRGEEDCNSQIWSKSALEVVAEVSEDVSREIRSAVQRLCRSASVDSPLTSQVDKPKRGRPRKTQQLSDGGGVAVGGGSLMLTRTRTRTNSTSSTKSDSSILMTSSRRRNSTMVPLAKIEEKGEMVTGDKNTIVEGAATTPQHTPPKRSRRGSRFIKQQ